MESADRCLIEIVKSGLGSGSVLPTRQRLQRSSDLVAQLGRGLFGERDGGNSAYGHSAHDEVDDALHQRSCLAAAGPCLDKQGGGQCPGDEISIGLVRRWRALLCRCRCHCHCHGRGRGWREQVELLRHRAPHLRCRRRRCPARRPHVGRPTCARIASSVRQFPGGLDRSTRRARS